MQIARLVPISYRTLLQKRRDPGFPPDHRLSGQEKFDLVAIRQYLQSQRVAHNAGNYSLPPPDPRQQAYAERATAAAAREKFKLEVEMAEYVSRLDANRQIETANAVVRRELRKAMEFELPPRVEMMKAPEIRKIMVAKLKDIISQLPHQIMGTNGYKGNGS